MKKKCCGAGMFIQDPDFIRPGSQISDLGSNKSTKKGGGKFVIIYPKIRDPGSEIRDPESEIWKRPIPDPRSRLKASDSGSGSTTLIKK
jgi:hypothetical protein